MKPIIQFSKVFLLCLAVFFAKESQAQQFPVQFTTQQGQCIDLGVDTVGLTFTTFDILGDPLNGQLVPGIRNGSWVYCPDSSFTGTDVAYVYYCVSGPTFPICDTVQLVFVVTGNNCNLFVTVFRDSTPCMGPLPSLGAVANGGTPPYTYLWSNGVTADFNCNLQPGVYCVTVTDANGCVSTSCETAGCQLPITITTDTLGCLTPSVSGGSPPYTFLWSDNSTTMINCNTIPTVPLCVTVTDAQGCTGFACGTSGCNLFAAVTSGGSCLVTTTAGGTPPYTYAWSNGSTVGPTMCPGTSGTYCVTITDAQGCITTACGTTNNGCNFSATINQSGSCLTVLPIGGTAPFNFAWSNGAFSDSVMCTGAAGSYCVTVTDAQGCTEVLCGTISGCTIPVTIFLDSSNCMNAVASGGSAPYYYEWSTGEIGNRICPTFSGTYVVTATDAQGCSGTASFTNSCQLAVAVTFDSLNNCAVPTVTGGTPPYAYQWSDGNANVTTCNITPGIPYCVTVVDANGCAGTACLGQTGGCAFSSTQTSSPVSGSIIVLTATFDQSLRPADIIWDFADGTVGSGMSFTRLVDTCNISMQVTMSLFDSTGNILCSSSQQVFVYCDSMNQFCQAYFTSYQDSANNQTFHFADQSVYTPVSYQWDFGDGNFSSLQNPSHTYASAGFYNVCLVITTASGCSSTYCRNVNAGNVQIKDLAVYLYHYTTVTPGFSVWANISYCNYGTTAMNGIVEYRYPTGTNYTSATPSPTMHDAAQRLLIFNFSALLPGTCGYIAVDLMAQTSLPLGTVVHDTAWVYPVAGDINPANNISTVSETVVGSWDPNDKAVSPKGIGDDGEIPENTEVLTYKIRFQNTGTAPAVNVVIRDELDSNIDLTSVEVMDASHEHITQLIGNELVVSFHNIMLPDSNVNEPSSHGYIFVKANLKPGLTRGTQIFNTAAIYFDFNEPVITNTVVSTLKDQETGIRDLAAFTFSVMPNPAQDNITISGGFSLNSVYEIMNELGQVVISDDVTSNKMQINIGTLAPGVYLLRVKSSEKVGVQRMIVAE